MPTSSPEPRNPAWTKARLEHAMRLRFGTRGGRLDTAAAAEAMGVSPGTIRRWLRTSSGRSLPPIPPARLEQFLTLLRPDDVLLRREAQQARYAARAIEDIKLPREMGIQPSWKTQRWLEPHRVAVLEVRVDELKIRQLALVREDPKRLADLGRRTGRVVDQATVPTRFHATLLIHDALTDLAPWRFQAAPEHVAQGFTWAWIVERTTPRTHLKTTGALLQGGHIPKFSE